MPDSVPLRWPLRRIAALLLGVLALGLVACGGDEKADKAAAFKKSFIPINSHILQVNEEIVKTLTGQRGRSDTQFASFMEVNASAERNILADLKKLDPPQEYAQQTKLLTTNVGLVAEDLESLVAATKVRDLKQVKKSYEHLIATSDKVQKSRKFLASKTGAQLDP